MIARALSRLADHYGLAGEARGAVRNRRILALVRRRVGCAGLNFAIRDRDEAVAAAIFSTASRAQIHQCGDRIAAAQGPLAACGHPAQTDTVSGVTRATRHHAIAGVHDPAPTRRRCEKKGLLLCKKRRRRRQSLDESVLRNAEATLETVVSAREAVEAVIFGQKKRGRSGADDDPRRRARAARRCAGPPPRRSSSKRSARCSALMRVGSQFTPDSDALRHYRLGNSLRRMLTRRPPFPLRARADLRAAF